MLFAVRYTSDVLKAVNTFDIFNAVCRHSQRPLTALDNASVCCWHHKTPQQLHGLCPCAPQTPSYRYAVASQATCVGSHVRVGAFAGCAHIAPSLLRERPPRPTFATGVRFPDNLLEPILLCAEGIACAPARLHTRRVWECWFRSSSWRRSLCSLAP